MRSYNPQSRSRAIDVACGRAVRVCRGGCGHASDFFSSAGHGMEQEIDRIKPTHVIVAAGLTGRPNVDWCETHQEETIRYAM
jgi:hypothetical protein